MVIFRIIVILLCIFPLAGKGLPLKKDNVPEVYRQYYMSGNFSQCAVELESISQKGRLSTDQKNIYADCLFFSKKYEKSFQIYESLLASEVKDKTRILYRLMDIYRVTEELRYGTIAGHWLEKFPERKSEMIQLGHLSLQKKHFALFLQMYEKQSFSVSEAELNEFIKGADDKTLNRFLLVIKESNERRKLIKATAALQRQQYEIAEKLAGELLGSGEDAQARFMLARIFVARKNISQAENILQPLANGNEPDVVIYTRFFFDNGMAQKALDTAEEKMQKFGGATGGFLLRDASIFYMMAMGKLVEATARLEIYNEDKKIFPHTYYSRKDDLLRHGNRLEYIKGIRVAMKERPVLCLRLIEAGMYELSSSELAESMVQCEALNIPLKRIVLLSQISGAEKYGALAIYFSRVLPKDDQEKFVQAKALSETGNTMQALAIAQSLLSLPAYSRRDELFMIAGKALFLEKKYPEAAGYFAQAKSREARKYQAFSYLYAGDYNRLKNLIAEKPDMPDTLYFKALWSISTNQLKQAEILLESYLSDAGPEGNKAVYFLFLLKYFQQNDDLFIFLGILAVYPHGLSEKNWVVVENFFQEENKTEFQVFVTFWYARYLMYEGQEAKANKILAGLVSSANAELLREEIEYLLAEKNIRLRKQFLEKFPLSPWRAGQP